MEEVKPLLDFLSQYGWIMEAIAIYLAATAILRGVEVVASEVAKRTGTKKDDAFLKKYVAPTCKWISFGASILGGLKRK